VFTLARLYSALSSYHESEVALFSDLIGLSFDALHLGRDARKANGPRSGLLNCRALVSAGASVGTSSGSSEEVAGGRIWNFRSEMVP
jgi:hypothetical protein